MHRNDKCEKLATAAAGELLTVSFPVTTAPHFFLPPFFFFKLNISLFQEYALNPAMKYCFVCFYRVEAKDTLLYCCCQIFYPISNFLFRNPKDFSSNIFWEVFFFKLFIDDNSFFPPLFFIIRILIFDRNIVFKRDVAQLGKARGRNFLR